MVSIVKHHSTARHQTRGRAGPEATEFPDSHDYFHSYPFPHSITNSDPVSYSVTDSIPFPDFIITDADANPTTIGNAHNQLPDSDSGRRS